MAKKKSWSPHPYLVAAARKVWRWSSERRAVINECERGVKKGKLDTRERQCSECNKWFPSKSKQIHIDHIEPVGKQPRDWDEYAEFYRRLFCPKSNLRPLCLSCHKIKTAEDRKKAA
jgi:5-methylcytosine-specific restriction endonuclease McrA